jgi:hypothetical protein
MYIYIHGYYTYWKHVAYVELGFIVYKVYWEHDKNNMQFYSISAIFDYSYVYVCMYKKTNCMPQINVCYSSE